MFELSWGCDNTLYYSVIFRTYASVIHLVNPWYCLAKMFNKEPSRTCCLLTDRISFIFNNQHFILYWVKIIVYIFLIFCKTIKGGQWTIWCILIVAYRA